MRRPRDGACPSAGPSRSSSRPSPREYPSRCRPARPGNNRPWRAGAITDLQANIVEHEEFGFRTNEYRIADAGLLEIGLGARRRGTRVAAIEFASRGFDDVAEQHQHRGRAERVEISRVEVRLQD